MSKWANQLLGLSKIEACGFSEKKKKKKNPLFFFSENTPKKKSPPKKTPKIFSPLAVLITPTLPGLFGQRFAYNFEFSTSCFGSTPHYNLSI